MTVTTVEELTILALKRSFYLRDGRNRRLTTVCHSCAWQREINGVRLCGRRKHWEVLKPDFTHNIEYIDANCEYLTKTLSPYPSMLNDKSIVYLDNIIKELRARGGRPSDG
jgi:hypothetical protein